MSRVTFLCFYFHQKIHKKNQAGSQEYKKVGDGGDFFMSKFVAYQENCTSYTHQTPRQIIINK
jgi:hypothetical protein